MHDTERAYYRADFWRRMLTREVAGLTSAERKYAMSAFMPYQSASVRYQQK